MNSDCFPTIDVALKNEIELKIIVNIFRKGKWLRKERRSAIKINPCSISLSVTGEQKSPVILAHSVIPTKGTKQLELKHDLASICKYCIKILKTFTFKREWENFEIGTCSQSYRRIAIGSIGYLQLVKFTLALYENDLSVLQLWYCWSTLQNSALHPVANTF